MIAARLGCAIPTKKTGEETFAQIVTDEPLLECRVLASVIGPNREEAIRAAMAAAGVTELVEGPRPISAGRIGDDARIKSLMAGLNACEIAVEGLIGAISGH